MTTPLVIAELSMLAIIIIGLILAALVVLFLWWVAKKLGLSAGEAAQLDPSAIPENPVSKLQDLIKAVREADEVTADDCRRMRELLKEIKDGGAPDDMVDPLEEHINDLCKEVE